MEQEPPQKLLGGDGHKPLLAFVGIIFPAKGDLAIGNVNDPVVGDSDAMCVSGQIVEDVLEVLQMAVWRRLPSRDETGAEEKHRMLSCRPAASHCKETLVCFA